MQLDTTWIKSFLGEGNSPGKQRGKEGMSGGDGMSDARNYYPLENSGQALGVKKI